MRLGAVFGIAGLVAAMLSPPTPAFARSIPICSGDGAALVLVVPVSPATPTPDNGGHDCAKACHVGNTRKRSICLF